MKTKILNIFIALFIVLLSSPSFSDGHNHSSGLQNNSSDYQGPFRNTELSGNWAQKAVHIIDNSTVGAFQSFVLGGVLHLPVSFVHTGVKPDGNGGFTFKPDLKIEFQSPEDSEVAQFVVRAPAYNAPAYSIGLFQINPSPAYDGHERGHSVLSATLGPLYLPYVIANYANSPNFHGGNVEDHADMEANPEKYALTKQVEFGLGVVTINGEKKNVLVLSGSIDQTQQQSHLGSYSKIDSLKIYQWFKTKVYIPTKGQDEDCECEYGPLTHLSLSLLEKNMEFTATGDLSEGAPKFIVKTKQVYGNVDYNEERLKVTPLSWSAQMGGKFTLMDGLNYQVTIGPTLGTEYSDDNFKFTWGAGLTNSFSFLDYIRLENELNTYWDNKGDYNFSTTTSLTNEWRNPREDFGYLNYLEFGLEHKHEDIHLYGPDKKIEVDSLNFTVGGRF